MDKYELVEELLIWMDLKRSEYLMILLSMHLYKFGAALKLKWLIKFWDLVGNRHWLLTKNPKLFDQFNSPIIIEFWLNCPI